MYTFVADIWDWKKDFKGLLANIINVDHILPYIYLYYTVGSVLFWQQNYCWYDQNLLFSEWFEM